MLWQVVWHGFKMMFVFICRFQDKLLINIGGNRVHTINVMAYGMGTTIVSDPPMMPAVNFGPQFSHKTCCKVFKLTNNGRRSQQLYWMTEGFSNYKAKLKKERRNKELDKTCQVCRTSFEFNQTA